MTDEILSLLMYAIDKGRSLVIKPDGEITVRPQPIYCGKEDRDAI